MATKETLKTDIDQLPEASLEAVDRFIKSLTRPPGDRAPLSGFKLGGHFDKVSIRDQAYE